AAVWAVTIVVATWPLMLSVERVLWRRRGLAVCAMTALLLLVLIVPLALAVMTIVGHIDQIVGWGRGAAAGAVPPPPPGAGRAPARRQKPGGEMGRLRAAEPRSADGATISLQRPDRRVGARHDRRDRRHARPVPTRRHHRRRPLRLRRSGGRWRAAVRAPHRR